MRARARHERASLFSWRLCFTSFRNRNRNRNRSRKVASSVTLRRGKVTEIFLERRCQPGRLRRLHLAMLERRQSFRKRLLHIGDRFGLRG